MPIFAALEEDLMEALNGCREVGAQDNISGDPVPSLVPRSNYISDQC